MTNVASEADRATASEAQPDRAAWLDRYLGFDIAARRRAIAQQTGGGRARSASFSIGAERGAPKGAAFDATPNTDFDAAHAKAKPKLDLALAIQPTTPPVAALRQAFDRDHAAMQAAAKRVDYAGALQLLAGLVAQADQLKAAQVAANKQAAAAAKLAGQKDQQKQMNDTLGAVERSYFAAGAADNLDKAKLNAGKTFKAVTAALRAVEKDKSAENLDELEARAQAYLAHFEKDYSSREKKSKESQRKKEACETALTQVKHWRLLDEFRGAGDPPWDAVTDTKVQGINAKMVFEQNLLTVPDKSSLLAKPEGEQGVSESYWIKNTQWGDSRGEDKKARQLFFKPMDGEDKMPGIPQGGSAVREVAGKAIGDVLKNVTGFDVGMPDACLTSISNDLLAGEEGQPDPNKDANRLGSLQQFVASDGSFQEAARKDPTLLARIPAKETQKLAVLDLISLNQDRHMGNAMVNGAAAGGTPSLTPIDQGLVMPSRAGFNARRLDAARA